jgi:hypothetical protein
MFNFVHNYKFFNDKREKKFTSYIHTDTAYFCFTVSFEAVDVDFHIFLLKIATGLSQLHVPRHSFRKQLRCHCGGHPKIFYSVPDCSFIWTGGFSAIY